LARISDKYSFHKYGDTGPTNQFEHDQTLIDDLIGLSSENA
jgi:hypothetical protein